MTDKVGLADIAAVAEVSIATVSNYLNYPDRVSPSTKEKIRSAIAKTGYRPSPSRIKTGSSPSRVIGFIMTDIEHSLFTSIFEGAQEVCEDNDYQLIGANSFSSQARQTELTHTFVGLGVAGLLISSVHDSVSDVEWARSAGIPVVMIDHVNPIDGEPVCTVLENNVSVGIKAANELVSAGCRHIAFIAHSFDYQTIEDRYLGARKAVKELNSRREEEGSGRIQLELIDSEGILEGDGYRLINRLEESESSGVADGLICATDQLAIGAIRALAKQGKYRVPKNIKVIGCEGMRLDKHASVSLTTVVAPAADMGRKAASLLFEELDKPHGHVHETVSLEPTLIRRESTAH